MRKEINFTSGIRLLCALTAGLFLLSACGKAEQKDSGSAIAASESGVVSPDFEYRFVAETENGYYFWERMSDDRPYIRLMFMDKESGRVVPLCNKPDCGHEGKECNAYFSDLGFGEDGVDKHYLQYYEGSLYAVGISSDNYVTLFRIKADGSEWEISAKLYRTDYTSTGQWRTPDILIEDGYVYFVDNKQKKMKLERMPISGGTAEVVFEGDGDALEVQVYRIKNNDGVVFFQAVIFSDGGLNHDEGGSIVWDGSYDHAEGGLYRYDAATGQSGLVKANLIGPYSVQSGLVYYGNAEGLCSYSVQDQTTKVLVDQPMDVPNITLTKDRIIVYDQIGNRDLIIYDYEGTKITTVSGGLKPSWYFGGSSDILFGECADENGLRLCFLDLNRPLEELRWKELKQDE